MEDSEVVRLFEQVQQVPYGCRVERVPDELFEQGHGSCLEKNTFLGRRYRAGGMEVRYLWITFDWTDLPLPPDVVEHLDDTTGEHLALQIRRDGSWVDVDASWDPPLASAGFPVVEDWDGGSDTRLAVEPLEREIREESPGAMTVTTNREFFTALNQYLEEVRDADQ